MIEFSDARYLNTYRNYSRRHTVENTIIFKTCLGCPIRKKGFTRRLISVYVIAEC